MAGEAKEHLGQVFVQYLVLGVDSSWRMLPEEKRARAIAEFVEVVGSKDVKTYSYSLMGLKTDAHLLLWRLASSVEQLQENVSLLLRTGLGLYLHVTNVMTGLVRTSTYVRKASPQEQGILVPDRKKYLIVYPFTKTVEWYLLSREIRQSIMNEHIKVGRQYPSVRQILAYSFGIDDQEFIVAYETDDLKSFQDLVMALRETEARRYTLSDTPILVGVYRPLAEALNLLG